jgi:NhaA family Na+:H+ antiporter
VQSLKTEDMAGLLMVSAALLALVLANTTPLYQTFIDTPLSFFTLTDSVQGWVKHGLMSIFFLYIALELKYEWMEGFLADRRHMLLPLGAAFGGMLVPSLIYLGINYQHPENWSGFAIPCATDIAFSLCLFHLFGKRFPPSVRIFLLSIAIFDDLGAILIITLFYKTTLASYTTLAGVLVGLCIPSPKPLMARLNPWVQWGILPLFAFTASGVLLDSAPPNIFTDPLIMGISLGLLVGKPLGIFSFSYALIRLKWASIPPLSQFRHIFIIALFCGFGFTMSLFMGMLAFSSESTQNTMKLGVLLGSAASALVAYLVILLTQNKR